MLQITYVNINVRKIWRISKGTGLRELRFLLPKLLLFLETKWYINIVATATESEASPSRGKSQAGSGSNKQRSQTHYDLLEMSQTLGSYPSTAQSAMGDDRPIPLSLRC